MKKFTGARYSIAVNSASSAFDFLYGFRLKKKDIIWTVPNTFAASANSILLADKLDFVDIDKDTWNICLENLKKLLIAKSKKLPKALIVVHLEAAADPLKLKNLQIFHY